MAISINDILTKCQDLSSFEGRRMTDAQGESLYPIVHITAQDTDLLKVYINEAVESILATVRFVITQTSLTDTTLTITVNSDSELSKKNTDKLFLETISAYCMSRWMEDKSAERSQSYRSVFNNMVATALASTSKCKPTLDSNY